MLLDNHNHNHNQVKFHQILYKVYFLILKIQPMKYQNLCLLKHYFV